MVLRMPEQPIIFSSLDSAIESLVFFKRSHSIPKKDISNKQIFHSVSGNIFRAFHVIKPKPSEIFRSWAVDHFYIMLTELKRIRSREKYNEFLVSTANQLIDYWHIKNLQHSKIVFGPAIKMINILMKTVNESVNQRINHIQPFLHVAFDEFTLKPLTIIINDLAVVNYGIKIPTNPTMGYINTPELYFIIQKAIFSLCRQAKIDPIKYDYWCWDDKHKKS